MVKKGLTLLEILISLSLLGIIMAATSSIFAVAIRNYQVSFAKSGLQKDINLVTDDISRNVKLSVDFPASHNTHNRSQTTLILALPAINEQEDFIYSGARLEKDFIIYRLRNNDLEKITLANPLSTRSRESATPKIVLTNLHSVNFSYNDPLFTKIDTEIIVKKTVSNTELTVSGKNTSVRRNEE